MLNNYGACATKSTIRQIGAFFLASATALTLAQSPASALVLQGHLLRNASQVVADYARHLPARDFTGVWSSQTEVVSSSCEAVAVGTNVSSHVHFIRGGDGALQAIWEQPGWSVNYQSIMAISNTEAGIQRTTEGTGENAGCVEQSHDYYQQVSCDRMLSRSYVDVYEGGTYLGRYETRSVLQRLSPFALPSVCQIKPKPE